MPLQMQHVVFVRQKAVPDSVPLNQQARLILSIHGHEYQWFVCRFSGHADQMRHYHIQSYTGIMHNFEIQIQSHVD